MEDIRLLVGYAEWILVIGFTLGLFSYFSKKTQKLGKLLLFVLLPVWILTAITKGLENLYFDNSSDIFHFRGFGLLMAETLAILLIFGGITFIVKYRKLKKKLITPP